MPADDGKTNTVRLSARTTNGNFNKLVAVAKAKGWLNARGVPNISRALNFILDRFEAPRTPRTKRGKGKHG